MIRASVLVLAALCLPHVALDAQQPVTLEQAREAALARGPRMAVARADADLARAEAATARAYPNPTASLAYSKSAPQYHASVDQPVELPGLRAARIRAAGAGLSGALLRVEVERAAVRFQVDSAYLAAAAARELAALSATDAAAGLELVRVAQVREKAGDASELDVELAQVAQGGLAGQALADSLAAVGALLDLQALMGMPGTAVTIALADSLGGIASAEGGGAGASTTAVATPLRVAAAEADVRLQEAQLAQARAGRFATPSISAGVEWHDPTGGEPGYLPTLGVAIPLPLWDRNAGPIAAARAGRARAAALLDAARRDAATALAAAERGRTAARVRAERDRAVLEHARRVVTMSARGYREGAFPLTTVLEAQRSARDAFRQYVQDLAALRQAGSAAALAATVGGGQ